MLRELVVAALVAVLVAGLVSPVAGASGALEPADAVAVSDVVATPDNVTDTDATTGDATTAVDGTVDSTADAGSEPTVAGSTEETVTETRTAVDDAEETVTEAEVSVDETTTGTQETVDETVTDTEETVDDVVTGTDGTVDDTAESVENVTGDAEEDVTGTTDEITGAVNETSSSVNETLTGTSEELEDNTTTEALTGTIEEASTGAVISDVVSTAPADDATTDDGTADGPSTVAATVRFTDSRGAADGAGSDGGGPSHRGGAVGIGAVLAVPLIQRGATGASLSPHAIERMLVWVGRTVRAEGDRVRFWRALAGLRYSQYDDSDPLEHDRRAALYEQVEDTPGVCLSSLAEEADVPLSTARYHLRVLEREGLVVDRKIRGRRRFVPLGVENDERVAALSDEATTRVLDALARNGPSSVSALADYLDLDPSTVSYHLDGLEEAALVERRREGRAVVNSLTSSARSMLDVRGRSPPRNDHYGQTD